MKSSVPHILFALLLLALPTRATGTGLDCNGPSLSAVERAICGSETLRGLDATLTRLHEMYRMTLDETGAELLADSRKNWLGERGRCTGEGDVDSCLLAAYRERVALLYALADPGTPEYTAERRAFEQAHGTIGGIGEKRLVKQLKPLAEHGNPAALYLLGMRHLRAEKVEEQNLFWNYVTTAAEAGYLPAMMTLAAEHDNPESPAYNQEAGRFWWCKAASLGHGPAIKHLTDLGIKWQSACAPVLIK